MKKVLTIAGSDCSGGAGIQADIKTIMAHGCYGMSVITALTAQNTLGVQATLNINNDFVASQLDNIFCDIVPDSVKIGMLSSSEIIDTIASKLIEYSAKNIVLDTVMVSTSGHRLIEESAINTLVKKLLPQATIITPNISEAEVLSGIKIATKEDMENSAKMIAQFTDSTILIKGGHLVQCADDLLYHASKMMWFKAKRIDNINTHGTGCTLSSAIASNLAMGYDVAHAVKLAKEYVWGAINAQLDLGHGRGPLNHGYNIITEK